ncbi:hypothetical protein O9929_08420 [Vibrio lentus]|nr:hypothetical protein [Vibrio lentus]
MVAGALTGIECSSCWPVLRLATNPSSQRSEQRHELRSDHCWRVVIGFLLSAIVGLIWYLYRSYGAMLNYCLN